MNNKNYNLFKTKVPAIENEIDTSPADNIDMQKAVSIIVGKVSAEGPIEELMSVAADVAMKFHDGDSVFFFHYDKDMKTAQCTYETHRAGFPPICGSEPLYLDKYPALLTMMINVVLGLAAKKELISFSNLSSLLPGDSREARRMKQIGLRSVLGVAYKDGQDFIVVVNPKKDIDQGDILRLLGYILTTEISKLGRVHASNSISFGKGELAENEVYIGLLNGFELRTKYGAVTEKELSRRQIITFLALLLFQEDHMLTRETILEKIWGAKNLLIHEKRALNNVGYEAVKSIRRLFPSKKFLERDTYHYFIDRSYKITTELDAISYSIRDIEGITDDELRLKRYLELLERLSATVLPRQKHNGIEHIVRRYDEKKRDVQNTILNLMWKLGKYEELHSFVNSLSITRPLDTELVYWDIKSLVGLGKYSFAQERYQMNCEILSAAQQHELGEFLGIRNTHKKPHFP